MGCNVIVVAAGPKLRGTETRAEKAEESARLLKGDEAGSILGALSAHVKRTDGNPKDLGVLLIVTNPVEATVTWVAEQTRWPRNRIIGLGTTVETARFSRFLADDLDVDATSVWTDIIGEHGTSIEIRDEAALALRVKQLGHRPLDTKDLLERTRNAAAEIRKMSELVGARNAARIIERLEEEHGAEVLAQAPKAYLLKELAEALSPPATRFAIAAAVGEVVQAIGSDRGRVLTVSGFTGFPDTPDVALAVPFVVGAFGVACAMDAADKLLADVAKEVEAQVAAMTRATARK